jgi:hypothetical protein
MDEQELRRQAEHYKRVAALVSDEGIAEALLELAATYEAMADRYLNGQRATEAL